MTQQPPAILCIDDEANILVLRFAMLAGAGYGVHVAKNGERGLEIFRNEPVDLVVLDYKMPGMLGDEVAREMRSVRPEVPLLLVTAFHDLPTACTSVFDGVTLKGDSPDILLASIDNLLSRRR